MQLNQKLDKSHFKHCYYYKDYLLECKFVNN
jgi:hypothetical protein